MDCSLPGSSIHGILQARILEWVACLPPGHLPTDLQIPTNPLLDTTLVYTVLTHLPVPLSSPHSSIFHFSHRNDFMKLLAKAQVAQGLHWWSSGQDSTLPMQGAKVWPLVRELDLTCCNYRSHMPQGRSKILHATTKDPAQPNIFLKIWVTHVFMGSHTNYSWVSCARLFLSWPIKDALP